MNENQIVQAGIGRKFQTPSIYDGLTAFENLEISFPRGGTVFGALTFQRDAEVKARVQEIAEMVFLADKLQMSADLLSHGQKQWLEIGMLLIQDPNLLMLDEPVAGMSVSERGKTAQLPRKITEGRSVLVIEHDMKFVEDIAHKVTVLHQGQALAEGSMAAIKANPSPRVLLTAPAFACAPAGERKARAVNERSAYAPMTLDQYKASHGAGFACCSGRPGRMVAKTRTGAKSFPTARPSMISH